MGRRVKTGCPTEYAVEVVESTIVWESAVGLASQVPLARHCSLVTRWSQSFRQGRAVLVQTAVDHRCFVVDPGQHGRSGNPAHVLAVEIGEAEATVCQLIEIGGFDFTTKATQV